MQQLALPVRHEWIVRDQSYGKIAIEPFEPGLALTVAMRNGGYSCLDSRRRSPWVKIEACSTSSRQCRAGTRTPSTSS